MFSNFDLFDENFIKKNVHYSSLVSKCKFVIVRGKNRFSNPENCDLKIMRFSQKSVSISCLNRKNKKKLRKQTIFHL